MEARLWRTAFRLTGLGVILWYASHPEDVRWEVLLADMVILGLLSGPQIDKALDTVASMRAPADPPPPQVPPSSDPSGSPGSPPEGPTSSMMSWVVL